MKRTRSDAVACYAIINESELTYSQTNPQYYVQGGVDSEDNVQELKADNEKLRALVTVGQDASRQQEQLIEQLQKELTDAKVGKTLCMSTSLQSELHPQNLGENRA